MNRFKLFSFAILISFQAEASLLPSSYVVKAWAGKKVGVKGIKVRSTVQALEGMKPVEPNFKALTWYNPQTRVLRSRAFDSFGIELYYFERKLEARDQRRIDDGSVSAALFFDGSSAEAVQTLRVAGIPIKVEEELAQYKDEAERRDNESTYLARFKSLPVLVVGPGVTDQSSPQLWIDKDNFQPIRLMQRSSQGSLEIRFEDFRYQGAYSYPGQVWVFRSARDGNVDSGLFKEELNEVITGFDPKDVKDKEMRAGNNLGFTDAGNAAGGALRDLIKRYYGILR
jgi:hypothetical protein